MTTFFPFFLAMISKKQIVKSLLFIVTLSSTLTANSLLAGSNDVFCPTAESDASNENNIPGETYFDNGLLKLATEQPNGIAERVYFHYGDPSITSRSYAAVDVGNCSGVMIGPNIMMTAGHCGRRTRNATFHLYPDADTQVKESFECEYILHTFPDMDLNLFWCESNSSGENPGDKYGYVDFDIDIDPVLGFQYAESRDKLYIGKSVYSIWMNPIDDVGGGWHSIYSRGTITHNTGYGHWPNPNLPGPIHRCGNYTCDGIEVSHCDCASGNCDSCERKVRPSREVSISTTVWGERGASGSPQLSSSSHRLLIGPLSVVRLRNPGDPGYRRHTVSIADHLRWGFTDSKLTCSDPSQCCLHCIEDQINESFLRTLGITNPGSYYGPVDNNLDGRFDIHHDVELLRGESSRDVYWLGFESHRRNALWTKHKEVSFNIDLSWANLNTDEETNDEYITVLSHDRLNLKLGKYYTVTFLALIDPDISNPVQVCLNGKRTNCKNLDASFLVDSYALQFRAPEDPKLLFKLKKGTEIILLSVSIIANDAVLDFDSHDKRYIWKGTDKEEQAQIRPNGRKSPTQPDWAGVVYRDPSITSDVNWTLNLASMLYLDLGKEHRVCFDYKSSDYAPIAGALRGATIRIENEFGSKTTRFSPTTSWKHICTSWSVSNAPRNFLSFGLYNNGSSGAYFIDNVRIESTEIFQSGFESPHDN